MAPGEWSSSSTTLTAQQLPQTQLLYLYGVFLLTLLQMENLNVTQFDDGVVKCPFHPQANSTSLLQSNGNMFVGTSADFSGSDVAIIRTPVQSNGVGLSIYIQVYIHSIHSYRYVVYTTSCCNSILLSDPFYFVFRQWQIYFLLLFSETLRLSLENYKPIAAVVFVIDL